MKITHEILKTLLGDAEKQLRNAEDVAVQWSGRVIALRALIDIEQAPEQEGVAK